jgi:hypothetical protein
MQSNLDSDPFTADSPVEFTTELTNLDTIAASACLLKMTVPAKASFKWSDPWPSENSKNAVSWKLDDLAPMQSRTVKIRIKLESNPAYGCLWLCPQPGRSRLQI